MSNQGNSILLSLVACATGLVGCASAPHTNDAETDVAPPLVDDRPLQSAGSRCQGGQCQCRPVDAYGKTEGAERTDPSQVAAEGPIAEGMKRFEIRTGRGSDKVQVTVEGHGTMTKSGASGEVEPTCGYVDLAPGKHRLRVHVTPGAGQTAITPKLLVYELGRQTGSWYATFGVTCGESQGCTLDALKDEMKGLRRPRGLFDPCGSVKVHPTHWHARKSPEHGLTDFDLDLMLEVYRFEPKTPRGGACTPSKHE